MDMSNVQFGNNNPETLGWPPNTGFVPYTWTDPTTGVGYLFPQGVYQGTAPLWDDLLNAVVPLIGIPGQQGIHPGGFGVAGTWGAEDRDNVNSPGTISFHGCGRALDINSPWNSNGSGPQDGEPWGVPAAVGPIAQSKGFLWGGAFEGTSDPMHFELHLTPDEIAIRLAEISQHQSPVAAQPVSLPPMQGLEFIMSLTGAPNSYAQALKDIGNEFALILKAQQDGPGVAGRTASFVDIAANRVNNHENWDGSVIA